MKAIDLSRQSTGRALTVQECIDIKADGNDLLIAQLWDGLSTNPFANETLKNAGSAALYTAGYTALNSRDGRDSVNLALNHLDKAQIDALRFLALDVEIDGITTEAINQALEAAVIRRQRPIIYSAFWFWTAHLGNPTYYSTGRIPLWNTWYDDNPDFDFQSHPYGGWTIDQVKGEQYQGSTEFPGSDPAFSVDYSTFVDEWVKSGPGTQSGLALLAQAWKDDMEDSIRTAVDLHEHRIDPVRLAGYGFQQEDKARRWGKVLGNG